MSMTPRAVIALGIGQCVNWGVLYYAFAVLVVPLQRELGVDTWVVTGAFSSALLMSAALAPTVGRWGDRGRAAVVMQAGGFIAVLLLVTWALVPSVVALYLVWAGLGLCMAATLYEPAFIVVGRAHDDPTTRLRALALVTLFGGLASSVFLPVTAVLVAVVGWQGTVVALAGALTVSTCATRVLVLRDSPPAPPRPTVEDVVPQSSVGTIDRWRFGFLTASFAASSLASAAFTTNLVPALGEQGVSPRTAAMLGGLIGVMQLPGRALLMTGVLAGSPGRLVLISMAFQAVGLEVVALGHSIPAAAIGIMTFAVGAGLTSAVRPHLVQKEFGVGKAGYLNGQLARGQQLARAAGPIVVAWLAGGVGYGTALALLGGVLAVLSLGSYRLQNESGNS